VINVGAQLSRYTGERVALKNSRRVKSRRVLITDDLSTTFKAWRMESRYSQDHHPVFSTMRGTFRDQSDVRKAFRATVTRAGLDSNLTFHLLRHTRGSMLATLGWPVADIAEQLGDSIETVQAVYMHAFDSTRREAELRRMLGSAFAAGGSSEGASEHPVASIVSAS
jgi:integrase